MEQENKKKKIIVAIIGVLVLLVVVGSTTYAFFSATDAEEAKQITTAKEELDVKIEGSTHVSNIKPVIWHENMANSLSSNITENSDIVQIPITVTNNSSIDLCYDLTVKLSNLKFKNESLTGGDTSDIKYRLYEQDDIDEYSYFAKLLGDFENTNFNQKIVRDYSISSGASKGYKLIIYIQDTEVAQNKLQGMEFDVEIKANTVTTNSREGMTLVDAIMEDNDIKKRNPDFKSYSIYSDNDEPMEGVVANYDMGLYKMQNEDIYYFRGVVDNNYVYFGVQAENGRQPGYAIGWRIMRINKDKSVTLVYANLTTKSIKSQYSSNNTTKYNDSEIKKTLDKWYEDNIVASGVDDMVVDTEFCNDTNYDSVLNRLNKENPTPTLECDQENKVSSKIGLVTADEVVFAGGLYNKGVNTQLRRGHTYFDGTYTMTGTSEGKVGYYVFPKLSEFDVSTEGDVLPVITLKPGVKLISEKTYNLSSRIINFKTLNIGDRSLPYLVG